MVNDWPLLFAGGFGLYMIGYAVAVIKKNMALADILWGFHPAYLFLVCVSAWKAPLGSLLSTAICVWGLRLGLQVFIRGGFSHEDPRYTAFRHKWGDKANLNAFLYVFFGQWIWSLILCVPFMLFIQIGVVRNLAAVVFFGVAIGGLLLEAWSDLLLHRHISSGRKDVCDYGPWSQCQHPNYLGEMIFWWGLSFTVIANYFDSPLAWKSLLTLLGPALISFLLVKVTGIPLVQARRAGREKYKAYCESTPLLLPKFLKAFF